MAGAEGRRLGRLPTMVALVSVAVACQSSPPASPSPPAPSPAPVGGDLRVGMDLAEVSAVEPQKVLDPHLSYWGAQWELFRCCLARMPFSYNGRPAPEGGTILRPDLAAAWPTVSADGLTWTIRLKRGIRYAPPFEQTEVVAADVVRGLERALRPRAGTNDPGETEGDFGGLFIDTIVGAEAYAGNAASTISGLEVPDSHTLVVHLVRPTADLPYRLGVPAAVPVPPGAADGRHNGYGRYFVASGPYMIEGSENLRPSLPLDQQPPLSGHVLGESITLVRNPSWDPLTDGLRAALPNRILVKHASPEDAHLVESGELDVLLDGELTDGDVIRYRGDPVLSSRLHEAAVDRIRRLTMNLAQAPFDDIAVRRAVSFAVDRAAILRLYGATARLHAHALPDSVTGTLLADYDPFATPDRAGSPTRAAREMAASRYDSDGDGRCDAEACRGVRTLVVEPPPHPEIAAIVAASLEPLGLTLATETHGFGDFFGLLNDPGEHVGLAIGDGWISDYPSGANWLEPTARSTGIGLSNGSLIGASPEQLREAGYPSGVSVPGLDERIDDCASRSGSVQAECWAVADQFLMERITPWVPLVVDATARLVSDRVVAFSYDASIGLPALDRIAVR